MVEISLSGSGEGPGWVTAPGYSTGPFSSLSAEYGGYVKSPGERPGARLAGDSSCLRRAG